MVVRVNKTKNYTVMSNHHLIDRNLTLKAKGLLSVVLSLPEDWEYSVSGLASISKEKETSINSALRELKENGYLVITKKLPNQTTSGRIEYEWDFYEIPQTAIQEGKKQDIENQGLEFLMLENQAQINTNIENTNKENTKEISIIGKPQKKSFVAPTVEEVAEYCNERGSDVDPEKFVAYYSSQQWKKANGRPVVDWKACVITWEKKNKQNCKQSQSSGNPFLELLQQEGYKGI